MLTRARRSGLQRYFARFEFDTSATLLCSSDATPLSVSELLGLADADSRSQWDALTLGYTEPAGLPALREEIARCVQPGVSLRGLA